MPSKELPGKSNKVNKDEPLSTSILKKAPNPAPGLNPNNPILEQSPIIPKLSLTPTGPIVPNNHERRRPV